MQRVDRGELCVQDAPQHGAVQAAQGAGDQVGARPRREQLGADVPGHQERVDRQVGAQGRWAPGLRGQRAGRVGAI